MQLRMSRGWSDILIHVAVVIKASCWVKVWQVLDSSGRQAEGGEAWAYHGFATSSKALWHVKLSPCQAVDPHGLSQKHWHRAVEACAAEACIDRPARQCTMRSTLDLQMASRLMKKLWSKHLSAVNPPETTPEIPVDASTLASCSITCRSQGCCSSAVLQACHEAEQSSPPSPARRTQSLQVQIEPGHAGAWCCAV